MDLHNQPARFIPPYVPGLGIGAQEPPRRLNGTIASYSDETAVAALATVVQFEKKKFSLHSTHTHTHTGIVSATLPGTNRCVNSS